MMYYNVMLIWEKGVALQKISLQQIPVKIMSTCSHQSGYDMSLFVSYHSQL